MEQLKLFKEYFQVCNVRIKPTTPQSAIRKECGDFTFFHLPRFHVPFLSKPKPCLFIIFLS